MTAVSMGALRCYSWWEVYGEKVLRTASLALLTAAVVLAELLACLRPAAEPVIRFLSVRTPGWWFLRTLRALERTLRGLPLWAEALLYVFAVLPLACLVGLAALVILGLACAAWLAGLAAEDCVPCLHRCWEVQVAAWKSC